MASLMPARQAALKIASAKDYRITASSQSVHRQPLEGRLSACCIGVREVGHRPT
jgi:hypothetical protein